MPTRVPEPPAPASPAARGARITSVRARRACAHARLRSPRSETIALPARPRAARGTRLRARSLAQSRGCARAAHGPSRSRLRFPADAPPRPRRPRSRLRAPPPLPHLTLVPNDFSPTADRLRIQAALPQPSASASSSRPRRGRRSAGSSSPAPPLPDLRWNGRLPAPAMRTAATWSGSSTARRWLPPRSGSTRRRRGSPNIRRAQPQPDAVPGRQRAPHDDLAERRRPARVGQDPLHADRAGARALRGDAHAQLAADDLRADGEPPARQDTFTWHPHWSIGARTYLIRITAPDGAGNRRTYGADNAATGRRLTSAVVRVLGVDAGFTPRATSPRAPPGSRSRRTRPS